MQESPRLPDPIPNARRRSLLMGGLAALLGGCGGGGGGTGGGPPASDAPLSIALPDPSVTATVDTTADLRAVSKAAYEYAIVHGAYAPGDGGYAIYRQAAHDGSIDNSNTTVIAADGGVWKKLRTEAQL